MRTRNFIFLAIFAALIQAPKPAHADIGLVCWTLFRVITKCIHCVSKMEENANFSVKEETLLAFYKTEGEIDARKGHPIIEEAAEYIRNNRIIESLRLGKEHAEKIATEAFEQALTREGKSIKFDNEKFTNAINQYALIGDPKMKTILRISRQTLSKDALKTTNMDADTVGKEIYELIEKYRMPGSRERAINASLQAYNKDTIVLSNHKQIMERLERRLKGTFSRGSISIP